MALPGHRGRAIATHKISIGGFADGHPVKDDKFTIRYFDPQRKCWLVNERLQERLVAHLAELGVPNADRPQMVPVLTPYDTVGQAIFSELAMWAAGRYVCRCDRFVPKPQETAERQGLPWPPPPNPGREYFMGVAVRNYWAMSGTGKNRRPTLKAVENVPCDPLTCPFCRGVSEEDVDAYREVYGRPPSASVIGQVLCKPHCVVPLILPWVGNESPRAKFVTSAWTTTRALQRTLEEIHTATGGILCGLPLRLELKWHQQQTPRGAQWNPVVEFAPQVEWSRLALVAGEHARQLAENAQAQAMVRGHLKALEGVVDEELAGEHVEAFQQEFGAGVREEQPFADDMQRRFCALARRSGWSPRKIDAFLAGAGSSEEIVRQIEAFERDLGLTEREGGDREPTGSTVVDAEFEDATHHCPVCGDPWGSEADAAACCASFEELDPNTDPFPDAPEVQRARRLLLDETEVE